MLVYIIMPLQLTSTRMTFMACKNNRLPNNFNLSFLGGRNFVQIGIWI